MSNIASKFLAHVESAMIIDNWIEMTWANAVKVVLRWEAAKDRGKKTDSDLSDSNDDDVDGGPDGKVAAIEEKDTGETREMKEEKEKI